jgi:hypothetical protein
MIPYYFVMFLGTIAISSMVHYSLVRKVKNTE